MPQVINLGQVSAIKVSSTPPINTKLLWYDTNITSGVNIKYYDLTLSQWVLLNTGIGTEINDSVIGLNTTWSSQKIKNELDNIDLSNYYTKTDLQTQGQAQVHWDNITNAPGFITSVTWNIITGSQLSVNVGGFNNDVGYITSAALTNYLQIGDNISNLNNDAGYITSADVPTYTFTNGLREQGGTVKLGLDLSTLGTTNIGILTESTYLVLGDILNGETSFLQISLDNGTILSQASGGNSWTVRAAEIGGTALEYSNGGNNQLIGIGANGTSNEMLVSDSINFKGLEESDDYSANKTQYSYVTVKMLSEYLQQGDNISLLNNDVGYITLAEVPTVDLSNYYTKTQLQTSGQAQVHWDNIINTPNYVPTSRTVTAGTGLTGGGNLSANISLAFDTTWGDSRYSQVGHTHAIGDITGLQTALNNKVNTSTNITAGYAMDISGSWSAGWGFGVDADVLDTRYLRKDINDSNGAFSLTLGNVVAETATVQSTLTLPSLADNPLFTYLLTIDDVTNQVTKSLFDFSAVGFMVQNAAGVNQFFIPLQDSVRFAAGGDASISFNATTKTVTITATGGSGSSGILSVFGRTGPNIVAELGDYNTSLVTEDPSALYFTPGRVRLTTLTGLSINNTAILATDTILQAFGKAQGQLDAKVPSNRTLTINGTSGNITVSGGTLDLSANRTWAVNLATVGTAGTYTKVTTDAFGRVISSSALVEADIPSLAISKITGLQTALNGKESLSNKVTNFTTTNNTLYPTTQAVVDYIASQLPTNYVTIDTNQGNITGAKAWLNGARWTPGNQTPTATAKSIGIGGNTNGAYIQGFQQSSTSSSFSLRAYAVSGVQLLLSEGGIDAVGNSTFATSVSTPLIKSTAGDILTLQGETNGLMYLSNAGLGIGAINNSARASRLTVEGNIWATDAYILGTTNTPIAEFGLDGNVFVRTMGTQSLSLQTNTTTRILIAGTGAVTISSLAGTGDRMVVANSSGQLSTQAIPSGGGSQTLTFSTSTAGSLSISGGNTVSITSLARDPNTISGSFIDWADALPAGGFYAFSSTTGATEVPNAIGGGVIFKRNSGNNPTSSIALFSTQTASDERLYFRTGNSTTTWGAWQALASEAWVLTQIPTVPTNIVTTNTNQTGLSGNKTTSGTWSFSGATSVPVIIERTGTGANSSIQYTTTSGSVYAGQGTANVFSVGGTANLQADSWFNVSASGMTYASPNTTSVTAPANGIVFTRNSSGPYIQSNGASSTSWTLRGYASSGIQILLNDGGIDIPTGTSNITSGYYIGGNVILGSSSNYALLSAPTTSGIVYLYPNGRGSATGRWIITPTDVTISSLTGSGTQMVTVNASGVLGRQAIPVNGVTSIATGTGLTGGTITSTGTISVANRMIPETSLSLGASNLNDVVSPGFYHQTSNANATAARNYPTTNAGALQVYFTGANGATSCIQVYVVYSTGVTYKRAMQNTTWSAWINTSANTTYSAGNGLNLSGTSFSLGTPGTITGSTTNSVTASSHTHALTLVSADITGALGFTPVTNARTVTAGNGLTGGGALSGNITITMGAPGSITLSSTNSVTSTSHTHALAFGGTTSQYIRGDGSLATFPTIPAAVNLVTVGSTSAGAVRYNGTSVAQGQFYAGSANAPSDFPSTTYYLNLWGYFRASELISMSNVSGRNFKYTDINVAVSNEINMAYGLQRMPSISTNTTYTLTGNSDGLSTQASVSNTSSNSVTVTVTGAVLLGSNIVGANKAAVISVVNFGGGQVRYTVVTS